MRRSNLKLTLGQGLALTAAAYIGAMVFCYFLCFPSRSSPENYPFRMDKAKILDDASELEEEGDGTYMVYSQLSGDSYVLDDEGNPLIYLLECYYRNSHRQEDIVFRAKQFYLDGMETDIYKFEGYTYPPFQNQGISTRDYKGLWDFSEGTFLVDKADGKLKDAVFFYRRELDRVKNYYGDPATNQKTFLFVAGIISVIFACILVPTFIIWILEKKKKKA